MSDALSSSQSRSFALFNLGFRPFYLLAAILAALSVPFWVVQYFGVLPPSSLPGMAWHAHEMVFGFAAAVIVGFLFTATRNWTGLPTPTGLPLATLCALWLAARILLLTGPGWLAAAVDVAFLPLAAWALWIPLARSRNRNRFFVAILLLVAAANLGFHLSRFDLLPGTPTHYVRAALFVVVFIVAIMAGRVTPSFTKNAVPSARIELRPNLDRAALIALGGALVAYLLVPLPVVAGVLALAAAVLHGVRMSRWDPLATRGQPILWILPLSYLWIPVGLLLLAAAAFTWVPEVLALHAFGVGAVGGMVIGMITRTARGHMGLPLKVGAAEVLAYILVHIAAVLRVVPGLFAPAAYGFGLVLSSIAWSIAFGIYVVQYGPFLTRPRVDGRPG